MCKSQENLVVIQYLSVVDAYADLILLFFRIPEDLESTVLCNGVYAGSEHDWRYILTQFDTKSNVNEKRQYLNALACTTNHSRVNVSGIFFKKISPFSWTSPKYRLNAAFFILSILSSTIRFILISFYPIKFHWQRNNQRS